MTTDADRLAADGVALRLRDRDVHVRFTFRSMRLLEARCGSLAAVNAELQQLVRGDHPTPFSTIPAFILTGLAHEPEVTEDDLLDLSPRQYEALRSALVDAINEGFPDAGKADEGDQEDASPGATSTTSPPSATDAAEPSSGP